MVSAAGDTVDGAQSYYEWDEDYTAESVRCNGEGFDELSIDAVVKVPENIRTERTV